MNERHIEIFYKLLNHKHETELRMFKTREPSKVFHVNSLQDFIAKCKQNEDYNIFAGVHERILGGSKAKDVVRVKLVPIDIDFSQLEPENQLQQIDEIENKLRSLGFNIKVKIFSGNGYHMYIQVPEMIADVDNGIVNNELLKDFLNRIKYKLSIEKINVDLSVYDVARVMRVPGTLNWKEKGNPKQTNVMSYDSNSPLSVLNFPPIPKPKKVVKSDPKSIPGKHNRLNHCPLLEKFWKDGHKEIPLEDPHGYEWNNVIGKNMSYYFRTKGTPEKAKEMYIKMKKNPAETEGWLNQPKTNKFNCLEVVKWAKEHEPEYYKSVCKRCLNEASNISFLDDERPWYKLKQDFIHTEKQIFPINRGYEIEGVLSLVSNYKTRIVLGRKYRIKADSKDDNVWNRSMEYDTKFLDDTAYRENDKDWKQVGMIEGEFYIYEMSTKYKKYTVFSLSKLKSGRYTVFGSKVSLLDTFLIGLDRKINTKIDAIFVHSYTSKTPVFNNMEEVFSWFHFDRKTILRFIYSHRFGDDSSVIYHLPNKLWEDLEMSNLFSGKFMGIPNHLLKIGPTGTGKTPQMQAMFQKFDEPNLIEASGGSTLKGILPSHKNKGDIGAWAKSIRVAFTDEFFKILNKLDKSKENAELSDLNSLLDHSRFVSSSGNNSFEIQMSAKVYACTNPIHSYAKKPLIDTISKIPPDTIGRFLFVRQNGIAVKWKNYNEAITYDEYEDSIGKELFLGVYDFLMSKKVKLDRNRVRDIISKISELIPVGYEDVFNKQRNRVYFCLLDGIVKWRCLCEKDIDLIAKDEDYKNLEDLMMFVISTWWDDEELNNKFDKRKFLTQKETEVLQMIEDDPEKKMSDYKLKDFKGELRRIRDLGLLWHDYKNQYWCLGNNDDGSWNINQ